MLVQNCELQIIKLQEIFFQENILQISFIFILDDLAALPREGVNTEHVYLQADDIIFQILIDVSVHLINNRLVYIVAPFCDAYINVWLLYAFIS